MTRSRRRHDSAVRLLILLPYVVDPGASAVAMPPRGRAYLGASSRRPHRASKDDDHALQRTRRADVGRIIVTAACDKGCICLLRRAYGRKCHLHAARPPFKIAIGGSRSELAASLSAMTAPGEDLPKSKLAAAGPVHVAIMAAKWSVSTSKLLAPTGADPTKDIAKRFHSDNPVRVWFTVDGWLVAPPARRRGPCVRFQRKCRCAKTIVCPCVPCCGCGCRAVAWFCLAAV